MWALCIYMNEFELWKMMSYAWTEIGLEDDEFVFHARRIGADSGQWQEIDKIILRDIAGSFSLESFLIFPLCLWVFMPDWEFDDQYIQKKMKHWHRQPTWRHYLNPMRLLGYPTAVMFSWSYRKKLKAAFTQLEHFK